MPNWVKNILTVDKPEALSFMLDKDEDGKTQFDFNKIIPMPEELEENNWQYPDDRTSEQIKALEEKYGAGDWYHWRVINWGTKWNASGTEVIDDTTVEFDTAWSTPEPIPQMLSLKFPDTYVSVKYADEDLGHNCGFYTYLNGDLVENTQPETGEALEYACDVWGFDYQEELRLREEEE